MPEKTQVISFNGALNSDVEPLLIPEGDYLGAVNFDNSDAINGSIGVVVTLASNRKLASVMPSGVNTCIGYYFHHQTFKGYFFIHNSTGKHGIYEVNKSTSAITCLLSDVKLNFDRNSLILHINIKDGRIYWVDGGRNDARKMNIEKARTGYYTPFSESLISAAKAQPEDAPLVALTTDTTFINNFIKGKLIVARTQYVYDDNEESAWSSISKRPFNPAEINPDDLLPQTGNKLLITIKTGPKNVRKINIAISDNRLMRFRRIVTIDKTELNLADNSTYQYKFFNDIKGISIPDEDSFLNYDHFPEKPKCQDLINDNIIDYANFEEGFDNIPVNIVVTQKTSTPVVKVSPIVKLSGTIDAVKTFRSGSSYQAGVIYQNGIGKQSLVQTNDKAKFYTPTARDHYGKQTTIEVALSHTPPEWAVNYQIVLTENLNHEFVLRYVSDDAITAYDENSDTRLSNKFDYLDIKNLRKEQLKSNKIIGYEFQKGDRISYIRNAGAMNIVPDAFDNEVVAYIENEKREFKKMDMFITGSSLVVIAKDKLFDSSYIGRKLFVAGAELKITKVHQNGMGVDFKFETGKIGEVVPSEFYVMFEGPFLKVPKMASGATPVNTLFEVYRPKQAVIDGSSDVLFYEVGESRAIVNPGLPNRSHQPGVVTIEGADTYLRTRVIPYKIGSATPTEGKFIVEDFHFSDYYESNMSDYGRFSAVNSNVRRLRRIADHRFSRPLVDETTINGLSRFYPGNQSNYEDQYGETLRIRYNNRVLTAMQELKVGKILVNQRVITDMEGTTTIAVSDQVLNDIRYIPKDYGIGNNPESYSANGDLEVFADAYRGVICMMSGMDIIPVSESAFYSKYWSKKLGQIRSTGSKIISYPDPERNRFIFTIRPEGTATADSVILDAGTKRFKFHTECYPEFGGIYGKEVVSIKDGQLWVHDVENVRNNFFGVQYDAKLRVVFNENPRANKILLSTRLSADRKVLIPSIKIPKDQENLTGMESEIPANMLEYFEGAYCSAFLRDKNTPNQSLPIDNLFEGRDLKGYMAELVLEYKGGIPVKLLSVAVNYAFSNPVQ